MEIFVSKNKVIISDFINGVLHTREVSVTLSDRIRDNPREVLLYMINNDIWYKYTKECDLCIERLLELQKIEDVATFCKFFLYKSKKEIDKSISQ